MALRIEDYALIGDCETAALVGRDGSIDWLCWPRFDRRPVSPRCWARRKTDGGSSPPPTARPVSRGSYRRDTLILETEFETAEGTVA